MNVQQKEYGSESSGHKKITPILRGKCQVKKISTNFELELIESKKYLFTRYFHRIHSEYIFRSL